MACRTSLFVSISIFLSSFPFHIHPVSKCLPLVTRQRSPTLLLLLLCCAFRVVSAAAAPAAASPPPSDGELPSCSSLKGSSSNREAKEVCVVGVSEALSLEGVPVCQATAASVEGPLGGPSPPPLQQRRVQSGYIPYNPYGLSRLTRQLLELTELPFMILWVYFAYFLVIVALTAHKVKSRVWLSALVAGTLVGIGLNANAYRAIMYRGYPDVG